MKNSLEDNHEDINLRAKKGYPILLSGQSSSCFSLVCHLYFQ